MMKRKDEAERDPTGYGTMQSGEDMTEPQYHASEQNAGWFIDAMTTTQELGRIDPPALHGRRREWREWHETSGEMFTRTRGKWLTISGITSCLFTFALAVVWRHGHGTDMPLTYVLPLYAVSLGAIAIGCLEYLHRPNRAVQQQCLDRIADLEHAADQLAELMDEELQQRFYQGVGWQARNANAARTGTENNATRPDGRNSGEVLRFRQRG
jgi:hypothetical protein